MNFFERQDSARASSKRLTFFFFCGVFATAVLIHIVVSFALFACSGGGENVSNQTTLEVGDESSSADEPSTGDEPLIADEPSTGDEPLIADEPSTGDEPSIAAESYDPPTAPSFEVFLFDPVNFTLTFLIVSAIIGLGSLSKISELNRLGPDGIAKSLGGTPVTSSVTGARERRLYNVVEEIALSSGAPMPRVYILDQEPGVNACAIGTSPESAAVCVTRGALDVLSRDELQGVVAHEFSHIVNNDVKLDTRLIGVLFGLELLAIIALSLLRCFQFSTISYGSRSNDDSKSSGGLIFLIIFVCVAIWIVGSAGAFFGGLIRAAVSRQREYLADASAVQFTRNPSGIAGALKKIGALGAGSKLVSKNAYGASHMFFSSVFSGNFLQSLHQTHPPLVDRIRAIEPNFDGNFPRTIQVNDWGESNANYGNSAPRSAFQGVAAGFTDVAIQTNLSVGTGQRIGSKPNDARETFQFLENVKLDAEVVASCRLNLPLDDLASARALFYALLFDKNAEIRTKQLGIVRRNSDSKVIAKSNEFQNFFLQASDLARILAAKKIQTRLKSLERNDYETFRSTVLELCGADGQLDVFEYAVQAAVIRDLDVRFGKSRGVQTRFNSFEQIREPFLSALSFLASESNPTKEDALSAFKRGADAFSIADASTPSEGRTLGDFTRALNVLSSADASLKRAATKAFYLCVTFDGRISEREAFLLETCGAALGTATPDWEKLSQ